MLSNYAKYSPGTDGIIMILRMIDIYIEVCKRKFKINTIKSFIYLIISRRSIMMAFNAPGKMFNNERKSFNSHHQNTSTQYIHENEQAAKH